MESDERIFVLDRVTENHPDVSKKDAATAWARAIRTMDRIGTDPEEHVGIGLDSEGKPLEVVAVRKVINGKGAWLIKHAQRPPQEPILRELGFMPSKHEKDRSERKRKGRKGSK